jgi:basic amino acid/polyamine antiporter, APA family
MAKIISTPAPPQPVRARLSLWDTVSVIVGIIIGAAIYEAPPLVFRGAASPWLGLAVWAVTGLLCLIGALCYAELASTYPRLGGDYVYLTRAYGSQVGFLYGWAQLAVIQTGSIGMMAYVFADYAVKLWSLPRESGVAFAFGAVAVLTGLNLLGVMVSKGTQNLLTACKVLGLGGIIVAGLCWGDYHSALHGQPLGGEPSLVGALVIVFFAYGGWNDAAFVAAEIHDQRRNIPLALVLGTAGVMLIYLLVNVSYLIGLGFEGVQRSDAVAADVLELVLGRWGAQAISLLVMISALGAVNGLIFTSSRVYAALGSEHWIFGALSRWHPRLRSPVWSLLTQAAITLTMIAAIGSSTGRAALDNLFALTGLGTVSWEGRGGFGTLLQCTAPIFWLFFLLTALSLFVLRVKDRGMERSFRVPLFPVVPVIFCATCAYMLYGGIQYAGKLGLVGAVLLLAGVPLYLLSKRGAAMKRRPVLPTIAVLGLGMFFLTSNHVTGGQEAVVVKPDEPAQLRVYVPADAQITVDGHKTKSTGHVRRFTSPPLSAGKIFIYTLKANWMENGHEVRKERQARMQAGRETVVDFREREEKNGERDTGRRNEGAAGDRVPDVVYWPTPENVVEKMLEMASVKKGDVIYDLGCGDARILVMAAKKYGARGFGFDIDPQRVQESLENVRKNHVEHLVTIKKADIFELDLKDASVVTLYLLPELNVRLKPQLAKLKPGSRIVSHDFDMKGSRPNKVAHMKAINHMGVESTHTVYLWVVPWEKE